MSYELDLHTIKEKRLDHGYTLQEMAGFLRLESKANYYKREIGDTKFKSDEIPILSEKLNIPIQKIFVKSLR